MSTLTDSPIRDYDLTRLAAGYGSAVEARNAKRREVVRYIENGYILDGSTLENVLIAEVEHRAWETLAFILGSATDGEVEEARTESRRRVRHFRVSRSSSQGVNLERYIEAEAWARIDSILDGGF